MFSGCFARKVAALKTPCAPAKGRYCFSVSWRQVGMKRSQRARSTEPHPREHGTPSVSVQDGDGARAVRAAMESKGTGISSRGDDVLLLVKVQPGKKKSRVLGFQEGRWRLDIAAPPIDGKANKALVRFLAELLDVAGRRVTVEGGESSRHKQVVVQSVTVESVLARLGAAARDA